MENLHTHFVGLAGGAVLSMIAFSIVFIALAGLCLIIYGVKFVAAAADSATRAKGNAKAAKADAPKGTPITPAVAVSAPATTAESEDENILAVIGAVIASTLGGGFAVRSVRPVSTTAPSACGMWKGTSRIEAMEGF